MSVFRALPAKPSLEFERKEAKALLRQLRAGHPDAIARARARHAAFSTTVPEKIQLADAQLVIAREYGFASWPRLVRYFESLERLTHRAGALSHVGMWTPSEIEESVTPFLQSHQKRSVSAWRTLTAYVPRCYELPMDEVFQMAITVDEAKLALARRQGFGSWDAMMTRAAQAQRAHQRGAFDTPPVRLAYEAMRDGDLESLIRVVEAHHQLRHPNEYQLAVGEQLPRMALQFERERGRDAMRPIIEWLDKEGFDLQYEMNIQLCGRKNMKPDDVRYLLERGANPNWIAPNGLPLLEHAIVRYWNGDAVDLVATRTIPRKALWIAAGLGDVDGVRKFLDRAGKPTAAARASRPDFIALGGPPTPWIPNPDDDEILMEAFSVAVFNNRTAVVEYMASRGFPVDTSVWGMPMLAMAVGNGWVPMVECLLRCGASLDVAGSYNGSARDMARSMIENGPTSQSPTYRRIAELCGLDPDAILAARGASKAPTPALLPWVHDAFALAADDARRVGQTTVGPENLFFGLLGAADYLAGFLIKAGFDLRRFRRDFADRIQSRVDRGTPAKAPMHAEGDAVIAAALSHATEKRSDVLGGHHVLLALLRDERGPVATLLGKYGTDNTKLREELARVM
ncbi:MAG: Clp protease N-terminal domain-containing protein [Gemmatimonadaceae bacterium]|nr:Clp protease N-terminal domain-containing protein [Gemmatimonadaceae bacterium]